MIVKLFKDSVQGVTSWQAFILPPNLALRSLTSKSGLGVFASTDTLYKGAVFGRDSLEVAEDLLHIKPTLVKNILITLASLQGTTYNATSEEEPGKIVHEYRNITIDGKKIDSSSLAIFSELARKWGGDENQMAYYGSIDATPLFLKVLSLYVSTYGTSILEAEIVNKNGEALSMRAVAQRSVDWLMGQLSDSPMGLLGYQKKNPLGISNQVWKDSEEFYVHANGDKVNHSGPIASIEVQGLAYDALLGASTLFSEQSPVLMQTAYSLRDKTLQLLWQPELERFALGVNYTKDKTLKIIDAPAANQAALLDSHMFDELDDAQKQMYIRSIVSIIFSSDFLTNAGIRSRGLSGAHLISHWDYHGSFVSWPKETYDIAKGLRRQGFVKLAKQLENRILNVCLRYKAYPEFVYVDALGRVLATPPITRSAAIP